MVLFTYHNLRFLNLRKISMEVVSCYIYSEDKSLSPILLPDGEAVFVGRQPETKITDTRVSRKQVRLFASYSDLKVFVQQLGSRPCSLNGFKTEQNAKIVAQHGDRLEILYGSYPYTIEFNPPPTRRKKRMNPEMSHAQNHEEDFQVSKKIKTDGNVADETTSEPSLAVPGCSKDSNGPTKNFNIFDRNKETDKRGSWKELGDGTVFMYKSEGLEGRSKIAAYDMDGTLIKTLSGLVFPKDYKDWQLAFPEVPAKLKKMYEDGYKIVIMSNQGRLGRLGKITVNNFKTKIENIVQKIGVPMQVFLANGRNIYRKPCTGMWDLLVNEYNDGVEVIKEQSFYVGDAAGRPAEGKRKKDHSSADRLLAVNLGLQFFIPEEHFLGLKPTKFTDPPFDPKVANKNLNLLDPPDAVISSKSQEVIIMVGSPGSGKSHFAKNYLKNYHYINRDSLGSWQKCVAALEEALIAMKSVVIDNTNPDVLSRKRYLQVAASYKVPVRCFVMAADIEHVKHNNKFRSLTDPNHAKISDVIINSYSNTESQLVWRCIRFFKLLLLLSLQFYNHYLTLLRPCRKYYVAPNESEGFTQIVRIHFVPKFKSEEDRKLYEMYLLEN